MMKNVWWLFILSLCCIQTNIVAKSEQWAQVYRKIFSSSEQANNKGKLLKFNKREVLPFSQLIFSWNSLRPETGYFSFFVQARNAKTKEWSDWHKMIDWGAKIQRSYSSDNNDFSHYAHVRFEIKKNILADAFNLRVVTHDGADLSLLHSLIVTLVNFNCFRPEKCDAHLKQLSSVRIKGVPRISQFAIDHAHNHRICSPVSCTMLTRFLSGYHINSLDFAYQVFDDGLDAYGSWPFNMAHAFERCNGTTNFFTRRLNSFIELHRQLKRGIPVVVSVRGHLEGAPQNYPHGHLMVVVGWDKKRQQVVCHDPAFKNNRQVVQSYPLESFIRSWERSHRLTYWAEPTPNFT